MIWLVLLQHAIWKFYLSLVKISSFDGMKKHLNVFYNQVSWMYLLAIDPATLWSHNPLVQLPIGPTIHWCHNPFVPQPSSPPNSRMNQSGVLSGIYPQSDPLVPLPIGPNTIPVGLLNNPMVPWITTHWSHYPLVPQSWVIK